MTQQIVTTNPPPLQEQDSVARVVAFFEQLAPTDLPRLAEIYAANTYYRDPFNEVRGLSPVARIYSAMFEELADCRFEILETIANGNSSRSVMLTWNYSFRIRKWKPDLVRHIHGATHLKFDASGKINYHRDYWDPAEEIYSKLPMVGALLRFLKRRIAA